jgi:hypothetical protein
MDEMVPAVRMAEGTDIQANKKDVYRLMQKGCEEIRGGKSTISVRSIQASATTGLKTSVYVLKRNADGGELEWPIMTLEECSKAGLILRAPLQRTRNDLLSSDQRHALEADCTLRPWMEMYRTLQKRKRDTTSAAAQSRKSRLDSDATC